MSQPIDALATELETFRKMLPELLDRKNRFALIAGTDLLGVYDTYGDALTAGYAERGLAPFLVKQIAMIDAVANFTRNISRESCLISASL